MQPVSNNILWDITSTIVFPIGMYRIARHLFGKYVISQCVLPSSIQTTLLDKSITHYLLETSNSSLREESREYPNIYSAERIRIQTSDNLSLDGLQIVSKGQKDLPPEEQKWIVYTLPNLSLWQQLCHVLFMPFANALDVNLLSVNYRMTGQSSPTRPTSFNDLCIDIDSAVQTLLERGVLPKNIVLHGVSLGGATALNVAKHYQTPGNEISCVAQNTFSQIEKVAPEVLFRINSHISDLRSKMVLSQLEEHQSLSETLLFSLKDLFFSLPHLIFRVSYLVFSIIERLIQCKYNEVPDELAEIGKTILFDTLLTFSGFLSLILSPFTNSINQFNGSINQYFLNNSLLSRFLISSKAPAFVGTLLSHTDWNIDNEKAATQIKKILVVYAPNDDLIDRSASLSKPLLENPEYSHHVQALPEFDEFNRPIDHTDIAVPISSNPDICKQRSHFKEADARITSFIKQSLSL